jgi:hypothetical protein
MTRQERQDGSQPSFTTTIGHDRSTPKGWEGIERDESVSIEESHAVAAKMLTRDFVEATLVTLDPAYRPSPLSVDAKMFQLGKKCGVYLVTTTTPDKSYAFVLMMARNRGRLSSEAATDFSNLRDVRKKLKERNLPLFVPSAYHLTSAEGISGFSVEYLPNHVEMDTWPNSFFLKRAGTPYAEFVMNHESAKAQDFNKQREKHFEAFMDASWDGKDFRFTQALADASPYVQRTHAIKKAMVTRLAIINFLTGFVPREFCVNAGDFMADPEKEDFDLRLITIRGGWKEMQPELLSFWLLIHREVFNPNGTPIEFPVFDAVSVAQGIDEAKKTLEGK